MNARQSLKQVSRLPLAVKIGLGALVVVILGWIFWPARQASLPSAQVQAGEFVIDLKVPGKLRAENSVTVTAPPARINLQIIDIIPEGTQVKEHDFLLQFDTTELRQQYDDQIAELDLARVNLIKAQASMASHVSSLYSSLENSRASYRLAELRLDQMKFEADVRVEEARLSLKQSEISLRRSEEEITSQQLIDSADVKSLELKVKQAQYDIQKVRTDLDRLRLLAPRNGLVVHKEIWRGGEMSKVKIGDTPWRGAALIELPDLSVMNVETSVSEVDFAKVKTGLPVEIKLDAFPDPTFHGTVIDVALLARTEEGGSQAKVFDVMVRIEGSDPMLRPGMSATARIIIDKMQDKLWVPIESVFDQGGSMVVFAADGGSFKERKVELGARNDNFVVINAGLKESESVALVDPSAQFEEASRSLEKQGSKSDSDSPSKGENSQSQPSSRPPRGGGRRNR